MKKLTYSMILFLAGWVVCLPPVAAEQLDRNLSGWFAQIPAATSIDGGFHAESIEVPLPGTMGGATLAIPDVTFTEQGTVLSSGTGTTPVELRAVNGFLVRAQSYRLGPLGLDLGGVVVVPEVLGSAEVPYDLGQMRLEPDGALITEPSTTPVQLAQKPFPVRALGIVFARSGMAVAQTTAILPQSQTGIPLGRTVFLADGSLEASEGFTDGGTPIDFVINGIQVEGARNLRISDQAVEFSGTLHLPAPFGSATQSYETLRIAGDGVLRRHYNENQGFSFSYQGFKINLARLTNFSSINGFQFVNASIQFPRMLGGGYVEIADLTLKPNGQFDLYGFDTPAITILGKSVSFKEIGFDGNGFWGKGGWLRLPKDFPGELGGQALPVSLLRLDGQGSVKELQISLYNSSSLALNDYWALDQPLVGYQQAGPGAPLQLFLKGSLILPQSLGDVYFLPVTQLPIDPAAKRLVSENLAMGPLQFVMGGLTFDLKLIQASPRYDLVFGGTATVSDSKVFPKITGSGKTWNVDSFRLGQDGILGAVTLSLPGRKTDAYYAQMAGGVWKLQPYTPGVGLPVTQRLVVNQEGVSAHTQSSDSAPVAEELPVGTVLVADAKTPDVDTVGELTDHWYRFKSQDGKPAWVFGASVDLLK